MLYLIAIFVPPLALLLSGRLVAALLNLGLYFLAIIGAITFLPGLLFWGLAVLHAVLVINNARSERRNRDLIDALRRHG